MPVTRRVIVTCAALTPFVCAAVLSLNSAPGVRIACTVVVLVMFAFRVWIREAASGVMISVAAGAGLVVLEPVLAAAVAPLVLIGIVAHRKATAARASGMATVRKQRGPDQFVQVFDKVTTRAVRWSLVAEAAVSSVSTVAAVLVAGAAFAVPVPEMVACSVLATLAGAWLGKTSPVRTPPRAVSVRHLFRHLAGERRLTTAAALVGVAHGGFLVLAIDLNSESDRTAVLLAAVAAVHAVLLAFTAPLAQRRSVRTLGTLVGQLRQGADPRVAVVAAGLAVHVLRPLVSTVVPLCTALVAGLVLDWPAAALATVTIGAGLLLRLPAMETATVATVVAWCAIGTGTDLLALGMWSAAVGATAATALDDLQPAARALRHLRDVDKTYANARYEGTSAAHPDV